MWKNPIRTVAVALAVMAAAMGTAQAANISWSVGVQAGPPVVYGPPVYATPAPVYVAPPPPRYYQAPPQVIYAPPAVMWAPPPPPRGWYRHHHHGHGYGYEGPRGGYYRGR